ncbi:MAG: hypothetical protein M1268_01550 [Patescibacteria group bacterium]|nr:hypothetical protein [Patescibacteria group bacterium]
MISPNLEQLRPAPSAYQRMHELSQKYKVCAQLESGRHRDAKLKDGASIDFIEGFELGHDYLGPAKGTIKVCVEGNSSSWSWYNRREITFALTDHGLEGISFPYNLTLKIGEAEVADVTLGKGKYELDSSFMQAVPEKLEAGNTLADWVEQMIKEGVYINPPIGFTPELNK